MLIKIPLITCFIIGVVYPLCFWINFKNPIKNYFHHFHLGLACFMAGISLMVLWALDVSPTAKNLTAIWTGVLLLITFISWNKGEANPILATIPTLFGLAAFMNVQAEIIFPGVQSIIIGVLSGLILSSALYTMNLGHHYLNVHGLPVSHLVKAVNVFWAFVTLRAFWDIFQLISAKVLYYGDKISILQFLIRLDGFLLLIAVFFGTLFPLISLYFVQGTLKVKSTQSATGILYVVLSAVLIGDLAFKYYLIYYGLPL